MFSENRAGIAFLFVLVAMLGFAGDLNAQPTLTVATNPSAYTEDAPPAVIDPAFTFFDSSAPTSYDTATLTVSVTTNGSADDRLSLGNVGLVSVSLDVGLDTWFISHGASQIGSYPNSGAGSGVGADLVATFAAPADDSHMQDVLRALQYRTLSNNPPAAVTLTVALASPLGADSDTTDITITAVNDAPVLAAGPYSFTSRDEDDVSNTGDAIAVSASITDPDGPGTGFAVVGADNSNGDWQYSINNGANWLSIGAVSPTSAVLLASDAVNTRIRFLPNADWNGSAGILVRGWDQSTGSNGDTGVNTTIGTGFSSNTESVAIVINPVNDVPTFNSAGDPPPVVENAGPQTVSGWASGMSVGPANESVQSLLQFDAAVTGTTGSLSFTTVPAVDLISGDLTYTATGNGTATVSITLQDDGGAPDTSAPVVITITVAPAPTAFWVDPAWSGVNYGDDPDGAGPAAFFGIDAFAALPDAISAAQPGATLNLAAATYPGVSLNKALTLQGAAGVTIRGASPALTVNSAGVVSDGINYEVDSAPTPDDPTILIVSGDLTLSNGTVTESGSFNQAAIRLIGGSVSFGAGVTLDRQGAGLLIDHQSGGDIDATGVTLLNGGAAYAGNFDIEDAVSHAMDNPASGLVTWVAGNLYVSTAIGSIQTGIDAAAPGDAVNVQAGSWVGAVAINKPVTLLGPNAGTSGTSGSRVAEARVENSVGTVALFTVSAANVVIDGFEFYAFDAGVSRCVTTAGNAFDGLQVRNCVFQRDASSPASGFGPVYAIEAQGDGSQTVTVTGNRVAAAVLPGPTVQAAFYRGVYFRLVSGTVGGPAVADGNTIGAYVQDVLVQFAGSVTLQNNTFEGTGVDISEPNPGAAVQILDNTFNLADPSLPQALLIKYAPNASASVNVAGNSFNNHTVGVVVAAARNVTLDGNVFNNSAAATDYTHLLFSTSYPSGAVPAPVAGCGMTLTNNQFNHVAGPAAGRALDFQNGQSASTIGTIVIGTTGNENLFDGALPQYIRLQTATLQGPFFSPASNPAPGHFATNLDAQFNTFGGVAPASMTAPDRNTLESKVYHKVDSGVLGEVDFGFASGTTLLVQSVAVTASTPTPADNDYTRINNAVQMTRVGITRIELEGTFDWTETNAFNSWVLGSDGITTAYPGDVNGDLRPDENDDYTILVPLGAENVTLTSVTGLGSARVQGPGDVVALYWESFITFWDAGVPAAPDNRNWTISELELFDFDWTIAMFYGTNGSNAYDGTVIENNHIRMATDDRTDGFHNIGIHYAFGINQTIRNNLIQIPGNGVSDTGAGQVSASVGMQCNTSGGAVYDGLLIDGNRIEILNAAAADPERIRGFWENTGSTSADVTVSNNEFVNLGAGNDPASNMQVAFRMTSRSSASSTVLYQGNSVTGANVAFDYYPGTNGAGTPPVELVSNNGIDVYVGFDFSTATSVNLLDDNVMLGWTGGTGVRVAANSVVVAASVVGGNVFDGFATGVHVQDAGGSASATLSGVHLLGCGIGLLVEDDGTASLVDSNINGSGTDGVVVRNSGQLLAFSGNFAHNLAGDALRLEATTGSFPPALGGNSFVNVPQAVNNQTALPVDATQNWWGSPTGPTEAGNLGGVGTPVTNPALVAYSPWYASGTDAAPGTPGFQGGTTAGSPSGEALHAIPVELVWTQQPLGGGAVTPLVPAPQLRAQDGNGVLGFNFNGTDGNSYMSLVNNPTGASFVGSSSVQAAGGIANFSNLGISVSGLGYVVDVTGFYGLTVLNAPDSNPFNINNPIPAISTLTPSFANEGSGSMMVQVDGSDFAGTSVVRLNGSDRPTIYQNTNTLFALLPASDLATAALYGISVHSPAPGGGTTSSLPFTVNGVPTSILPAGLAVGENLPVGSLVALLSTSDAAPTGDTHTYALAAGAGDADNSSFILSPTGNVTTNAVFDREAKSSYSIRVRSTDSFGAWVEQAFTVSILDDNEAPTAVADSYNVDEDGSLNVNAAAGVLTNDSDPEGNPLTATLISAPANTSGFTLNPDGSFSLTPDADYFGPISFQYEVADNAPLAGNTVTVTVTVNPINDAPAVTGGSSPVINEDAGPQNLPAFVGMNPGPANEAGQVALAFSVQNLTPAGGLVFSTPPAINAAGTLTFEAAPDSNGTATFQVQVQDNGGTSNGGADSSGLSGVFAITVNAVNDAPGFTVSPSNSIITVGEDSGPHSFANWAAFNPGPANESAQTVSAYNISNVSNGTLFAAGPAVDNAGTLSFSLNADANGSGSFDVSVTDNGGGSDTSPTQSFTITVTPVNDAPSLNAVSTLAGASEDTPFSIPFPALAGAADEADVDGDPVHFRIDSLLSGSLTMNGNPVIPGTTVFSSGSLEWTPPTDQSGTLAAFTLLAWDGLLVSGSPVTVQVLVAAANDDPFVVTNLGLTVGEGATGGIAQGALEVSDLEQAAVLLTFTVDSVPANGTLNLAGFGTLAVNDSFTQQDINLGNLSYTHDGSETAGDSFTFHVTDGAGGALGSVGSPLAFSITVNPLNDLPTLSAGTLAVSALEDTPLDMLFGDLQGATMAADVDGSVAGFRVISLVAGTLQIDQTGTGLVFVPYTSQVIDGSDILRWQAPLDLNGAAMAAFTVEAIDNGTPGSATSATAELVSINVLAVNDQPTATGSNVTVGEDSGAFGPTAWAGMLPGGGADESGQTALSFNLTNVSNPGLFSAVPALNPATGELSFTPAANAFGVCTIEFTVQDSGGPPGVDTSAPVSFTITITAVNDAPTLGFVGTLFGGPEDSPIIVPFAVLQASADEADIDSSPVNFRIEGVTAGSSLTLNSVPVTPGITVFTAADTLAWTPGANLFGTLDAFTVTAFDGSLSSSTPVQVRLFVENVNDQPGFSALNPPASLEDAGAVTVANWAAFNAGPNEQSTQAVLNYNVSGVSTLSGNLAFLSGPFIDPNGNLHYTTVAETSGTAQLFATVRDTGGTASGGVDTSALTGPFVITVSAVNDAPTMTTFGQLSGALEDTGFTITYTTLQTAGDEADIDSATVNFRIESVIAGTLTKNAVPVVPGTTTVASGESLVWTPPADLNGVLNAFTIAAWDGALASSPALTAQVDVTAVNDMPSFTKGGDLSAAWDQGAQSIPGWASGISAGPSDEASQLLTFNVISNNNPGLFAAQPAVSSTGTLTFTPDANVTGTAVISIGLQDNGGTGNGGVDTGAPQSFNITITSAGEINLFRLAGNSIADGASDALGATFGVWTPYSFQYTVQNLGNGALSLTAMPDPVLLNGAVNCDAWVTHQADPLLAAGGSTTFVLWLRPLASGPFSADVLIPSSDADEDLYDFTVQGAAVDAPDIKLSRGFHDDITDDSTDDLGSIPAGSTTPFTYTVQNAGTGLLTFGAPAVSVTSETNCVVVAFAPAATLAASASDSMVVEIQPAMPGRFSFSIQIDSDDPDEGDFMVHGEGEAVSGAGPELELLGRRVLAPTDTENLGLIPSGSNSTFLYEVRNVGTANLSVTGPVSISNMINAVVVLTVAPAATVAPGAMTPFAIDVQPLTPGAFQFDLELTTNDADESPLRVTVVGVGSSTIEPEVAIQRDGIRIDNGGTDDVGDLRAGLFTSFLYRVRNEGTGTLNIAPPLRVSGESNCQVRVVAMPQPSVAPQDSTNFLVEVMPLSTGALSAILRLDSDDSNESQYFINLVGTGPQPDIHVEYPLFTPRAHQSVLSIGGANVGAARTVTLHVRNGGTGPLSIVSVTPSAEVNCVGAFVSAGASPVAPGGTTDLQLTVTPLGSGAFSATFTILSNDLDSPIFDIIIEGTGTASSSDSGGDDGGCSTGSNGRGSWLLWLGLLAALAVSLRAANGRNRA